MCRLSARNWSLLLGLLTTAFLAGCASSDETTDARDLERYQFTDLHMGMEVRLIMYTGSNPGAEQAATAAFRRIEELNAVFSHFEPDSELTRLNDRAGGPPVAVSDELFYVLKYAVQLARESAGAFDVTIGPLMDLWRTSRENRSLPDEGELHEARERTGWTHIHLDADEQTVQLEKPGMELDLGGIAKGYIIDQALHVLQQHGIERSLIEAGGDLVVSDSPPDQDGWRILVPYYPERDSTHTITVSNAAVSTSGDTEQAVVIDGVRYSHVINPETGLGLTDQVMATIVAPTSMVADGLSTAVSILGKERGRQLLNRYPNTRAYLRSSPWVNQSP